MTAADAQYDDDRSAGAARPAADVAVARVGLTCQTAAGGRRAIRALSEWAQRFKLTEPEFQVLWSLRLPIPEALDQTTLARGLAYSPAQVSATVERLRAAGWIVQWDTKRDRRRHRWQLSDAGRRLLDDMLAAAGGLARNVEASHGPPFAPCVERKGAA